MKVKVIIPCGGNGSRANLGKNKLLCNVSGSPLIIRTLSNFLPFKEIDNIMLPCSQEDMQEFKNITSTLNDKRIQFCIGGDTRTQSVSNALNAIGECDVVIIHDGARPYITNDMILECVQVASMRGSAITAIPATDTMAYADKERKVSGYIPRDELYRIQTPQAFSYKELLQAYNKIKPNKIYTDDSQVYADFIGKPSLVQGNVANIKLTFKEDFNGHETRSGIGYDTHRLVEGRKLIIGNVNIEHSKGLLGHSDADVLIHAIMDALLTACNMRDIGYYFPDTDSSYKGISSAVLLEQVHDMITAEGFSIQNISAVIMAEKPKLSPHIPSMISRLAQLLCLPTTSIGISATTTEGIGLIGREEGIACYATCSVSRG